MSTFGIETSEIRKLMLSVGENHVTPRPLTPTEVAAIFQRAINRGATKEDCARLVHFSGTSMVGRFLALLNLEKDIRHSVDWGASNNVSLGFSSAYELSRLPEEDQKKGFIAVLENRLNKSEVQQIVELRRKSFSIEDCIEQVLKFRPKIERQFVVLGRLSDPGVIRELRRLQQSRRDEILNEVLKELCPASTKAAGRLGGDRFSLVGDRNLSDIVHSYEDFECLLTNRISAYVNIP